MNIELLKALAQHANYMKMVRKCIDQGGELCRCVSHRDCAFGKWFYSTGVDQINGISDPEVTRLWSEIEDAHIQFHQYSLNLQSHHLSSEHEEELKDMDMMAAEETRMMQKSTILVNRILEIDKIIGNIKEQ